MKTLEKITPVNVAPSSTHGHYINGAKRVIPINQVAEAFFVEGASVMTSHNHAETAIADNSLVMPQQVFNPFSKMMEKVVD